MKTIQRPFRRTPSSRIAVACAVTGLSLGLAATALASTVTQWDGQLSVSCTADVDGQACTGSHVNRSASGFSAVGGPINGNDDIQSVYTVDHFGQNHTHSLQTQWTATANQGSLRAASYSGAVIPNTGFLNPWEGASSSVQTLFRDEWIVHGPSVGTRQISAHFSLSGGLGDLGGIALPFGNVNASFGQASADFGVVFDLAKGGPGQAVVVSSPNGSVGALVSVGDTLHRILGDGKSNTQGMTFVFDVRDGNRLDLFADLSVKSSLSAYSDFGHTATLDYILAPDDIGIFAASGALLRQGDRFIYAANDVGGQPPVGTVPEPGTGALVLCGLGCLGVLRVSRAQRRQ